MEFAGMEPTPRIITFLRTTASKPVALQQFQVKPVLNVEDLKSAVAALHQIFRDTLKAALERTRNANACGELPNFFKDDFVLIARDDLTAGEKLSLR